MHLACDTTVSHAKCMKKILQDPYVKTSPNLILIFVITIPAGAAYTVYPKYADIYTLISSIDQDQAAFNLKFN